MAGMLLRGLERLAPSREHLSINYARLDAPLIDLWAASQEREWYMSRRSRIYPWILIGVALAAGAVSLMTFTDRLTRAEVWWAAFLAACAATALVWCTVPYWAARRAFRDRQRAMAAYRVDRALSEVCSVQENLPLNGLFELNRRQLDEYQTMTKHHEKLAFRLTWGSAVVAFGVLITGIVLSLRVGPGTEQYVVSGLTGLGTALSAFLGRTFYRGHKDAMDQLNRYYREPSMTGRLLAAERIIDKLATKPADTFAKELVASLLLGADGAEADGAGHEGAAAGAAKGVKDVKYVKDVKAGKGET